MSKIKALVPKTQKNRVIVLLFVTFQKCQNYLNRNAVLYRFGTLGEISNNKQQKTKQK